MLCVVLRKSKKRTQAVRRMTNFNKIKNYKELQLKVDSLDNLSKKKLLTFMNNSSTNENTQSIGIKTLDMFSVLFWIYCIGTIIGGLYEYISSLFEEDEWNQLPGTGCI